MRILYGINGTGNGHRSRAKELVPALQRHAEVDILVSGQAYSLPMPFPVRYEFGGVSFSYRKGSVDLLASVGRSKPVQLVGDIRGLDASAYDLVISDFEPISAWAARLRGVPAVHVSHQASFLSPKTPRPHRRDPLSELFLRQFSAAPHSIGLHFRRYDEHVRPPIVRRQVRETTPEKQDHVVVYLPAIPLSDQIACLEGMDTKVLIFCRESTDHLQGGRNLEVLPASDRAFAEALATGSGVLCHAGFELPSEAMHLGKPLLTMPIGGQYEQQCNAAALERLGVEVLWKWDARTRDHVARWLHNRRPIHLPELTDPAELALEILNVGQPAPAFRPG